MSLSRAGSTFVGRLFAPAQRTDARASSGNRRTTKRVTPAVDPHAKIVLAGVQRTAAIPKATEGCASVLDHLSDSEAQLKSKVGARAGVEDLTRHLTYEDLEAYARGRLPSARMSFCGSHLESCDACRTELEDLRGFRNDASVRPGPGALEPQRRKRRRGVGLPAAGVVAVACVALVSAVLWWAREKLLAGGAPSAVSTEQVIASAGAPTVQTAPARPAAAQTVPAQPVEDAKSPASRAVQPDAALRTAPQTNTGFSLISPVGESTSDTRPEFRWQPLARAIGYSVVIVDAGLHRVQRSPAMRSTNWRPRRPLHRGQTYLWQVTATVRGGSKVVAAASPSPALVQIIQPAEAAVAGSPAR